MRLIRRATAPASRRKPTPEFTWEDLATATLPVIACFLGGATEKWAEGIVVGLLGLLLILSPPRFSLGPVFHGILIALVGCAALAFLPAHWFFQPAWRAALLNDFSVTIPATLSPQPWISFGCFLSFLAGLCWLYYVCGQEVEIRAARRQFRIFAVGVILLAALSIIFYYTHWALPFWHNQRGFGPFPNRNQTANLLGLTSIIIVACGHEEIRRHRKGWIFWIGGFAVVTAAIVLNFSRAGIAILLLGCALWLAVLVLRSGSKGRIAIGVSVLLVLLAILLLFGGDTLERFNLRGGGSGLSEDFRWLIFHDTFTLVRASPWGGTGLGNFEPVFAIFRDASVGQNRALHPESDWLWAAAEMGWPALLSVVVGAAVLVWRCFPFVEGTNQWFRIAALIAAILFALHGLVDVSGHRIGTAYAGVFLFGMALRRPLKLRASVLLVNFFRGAGVVLLAIGLAWTVASYRDMALPGGIGVANEMRLATAANVGRNYEETIARTTRALEWAPLDWQLYFLRALGKGGARLPAIEALDDFRRARFLEPNSFEVPYQEGLAWSTRDALLAMTAWREALRRAGGQRPELYGRMLSSASAFNPALNRSLEEFGSVQPDLALTYLERASGEDFASALARFLQHDSWLRTLTPAEKSRFFALWTERGDPAQLADAIQSHPDWLRFAWRGVAKERARAGDFRAAFALVRQWGQKPVLPKIQGGASVEQLQNNLMAAPNNYQAGFELYQRQLEEGRNNDALITVRRFTEKARRTGVLPLSRSRGVGRGGELGARVDVVASFRLRANRDFQPIARTARARIGLSIGRTGLADWWPLLRERRLGGGEAGDRDAKGTAADVVQAEPVAELHAVRIAAVFAADAELDVRAGSAGLSRPRSA